jgi:multidrug efflux pump
LEFYYTAIPEELAPREDRGQIRMFATAPEGASFEYMDSYVDQMISTVQENVPEVVAMNTVTSPGFGASGAINSAFSFITLGDANNRDRSQQEIADQLTGLMSNLTGAQTFVSQPQSIGNRRGGLPIQYVLQSQTMDQLKEVIPEFLERSESGSEAFSIC